MLKKVIVGVLLATVIHTGIGTVPIGNYVATIGTVEGTWEEPDGICTAMNTEYGNGCLLDGYYDDSKEYIVIYDTNGTKMVYDDEIVQVICIGGIE